MAAGTIFLADIRPFLAEDFLAEQGAARQKTLFWQVYGQLDVARREKIDRERSAGGKARSLCAGQALQAALRSAGRTRLEVCYEAGGRPWLQGKNGETDGAVSLSHSGDWAAAVVADGGIGLDIQKIVPVRSGVNRHFFTEREEKRWAQVAGEREAAFCLWWAVKESCMKLLGTGMSFGFSNLEVQEDGSVRRTMDGAVLGWYRTYAAPEGYVLAACAGRKEDLPVQTKTLLCRPLCGEEPPL